MSIKDQLKGKQYGEIITRLENVEITKVFDRTTGTGEYGPYSFQNGILYDGDTELKVLFKNLKCDAKELEGHTVNLFATETKSYGFQGVKLTNNQYTNKDGEEISEPQIVVTKAGFIELDGKRALYNA